MRSISMYLDGEVSLEGLFVGREYQWMDVRLTRFIKSKKIQTRFSRKGFHVELDGLS